MNKETIFYIKSMSIGDVLVVSWSATSIPFKFEFFWNLHLGILAEFRTQAMGIK